MKSVVFLLYYDLLAIKSWFRSRTLSKMAVFFAFAFVFFSLSFFIYFFSRSFFLSLTLYKEYGLLIAKYLVNAAILITGLFALAATSVSVYSFLQKSNKEVEYLLSQPVKSTVIVGWIFIKSSIVNALSLVLLFSPLAFAYFNVFLGNQAVAYTIRFYLIILLLTILTNSMASILGYLFAYGLKNKIYLTNIGGIILFFGVIFPLIHFIFPQELVSLYDAPAEKFFLIYNTLPLLNPWLPSTWVAKTLLEGLSINTLFILVLTVVLTILTFFFQRKKFIPLFHFLNSQEKQKTISTKTDLIFRYPLIVKDWLSIVRTPSENGYSLFLFSIALFFYFFLSRILIFKKTENLWRNELVIFSFAWFAFFASAFLLRLVYPLMAKEGASAWFIFTQPVSKLKILFAKLIFSLIITIPLSLFSFILWYFLPIEGVSKIFIALVTVLSIVLLTFINVLIGSILPNFKEAADPEKISTSGMGLIDFFAAGGITVLASYYIHTTLENKISMPAAFVSLFTVGLLISTALFFLSNYFLTKYEF